MLLEIVSYLGNYTVGNHTVANELTYTTVVLYHTSCTTYT